MFQLGLGLWRLTGEEQGACLQQQGVDQARPLPGQRLQRVDGGLRTGMRGRVVAQIDLQHGPAQGHLRLP